MGLPVGLALGLPDADGLPLADADELGDADALADVDAEAFADPDGDTDADGETDADGDALGLTDGDGETDADGLGAGGGGGRTALVAAPSTAPSDERLKTGLGAATMPSATARAAIDCGVPCSATDWLSACT